MKPRLLHFSWEVGVLSQSSISTVAPDARLVREVDVSLNVTASASSPEIAAQEP